MWLNVTYTCPKCGQLIRMAEVEPHSSNKKLATINYVCVKCGPVGAKHIDISEKF